MSFSLTVSRFIMKYKMPLSLNRYAPIIMQTQSLWALPTLGSLKVITSAVQIIFSTFKITCGENVLYFFSKWFNPNFFQFMNNGLLDLILF